MLELQLNGRQELNCILEADSFYTRLKGYMFQKEPMSKGILFRNCHSLHSYFMNFDIDLFFLDQDNRLVKVVRGFGKNQTLYVKEATHVLETPAGSMDASKVTMGQVFVFYELGIVSC